MTKSGRLVTVTIALLALVPVGLILWLILAGTAPWLMEPPPGEIGRSGRDPRRFTRPHPPGPDLRDIPMSAELSRIHRSIEAGGDYRGIFAAILKLGGQERESALHLLVYRWAGEDPRDAIAFAGTLQDASLRDRLMDSIMSIWPAEKLEDAFAWLATVAGSPRKDALIAMLLGNQNAARTRPEFVARYASTLPEGGLRMGIINRTIIEWASQDPEKALSWARGSLRGIELLQALSSLGAEASARDPRAALPILDGMGYGIHRNQLVGRIAADWGRKDPAAALAWMASLDPADRALAGAALMPSWALEDPRAAFDFASGLSGAERDSAYEHVMRQWGAKDPARALERLTTLTEPVDPKVIQALFSSWTTVEPRAAAEKARSIADESARDASVTMVAAHWVMGSPTSAAAFATGLPEGKGKNDAVAAVSANWVRTDSLAASQWLKDMAPGPSRDRGVIELVSATSEADPASALGWAFQIADPAQREKWARTVARGWKAKDAPSAASAIQSLNLSPADTILLEGL